MSDQAKAFDPSRFLTLVSGKEYLEVKWRLVWLRTECPYSRIETHLLTHANGEAVVKATVTAIDDSGAIRGIAEAHGSEDAQGFGDYLEKAETKAIGRALGMLGFGTQFTHDFEFGGAAGRVVDSPVTFNDRRQVDGPRPGTGSDLAATDRQRNLINALAREQKISGPALDALCTERVGHVTDHLTRQTASTIIEHLRSNQPARSEAAPR